MMKTVSAVASARKNDEPVWLAELTKRFVGTVSRRGEAVGAETDPREHRDQRQLVECVGIANVFGSAERKTS